VVSTGIHRRSRGIDIPFLEGSENSTNEHKPVECSYSLQRRFRTQCRGSAFYVNLGLFSVICVLLWLSGTSLKFFPTARVQNLNAALQSRRGTPRLLSCFVDDRGKAIVEPMDANGVHKVSISTIDFPMTTKKKKKMLEDSDEYEDGLVDDFETKNCKAQYPWQLQQAFPTCNLLHEFDLTGRYAMLVTSGHWRSVWVVEAMGTKKVLKTQLYKRQYEPKIFDLHRRDALAAERLTKYKSVVDMYGFCGESALSEYADGGDIIDAIWPSDSKSGSNMTSLEKLSIGKIQQALLVYGTCEATI